MDSFSSKYFHIAGSANAATNPAVIHFAHSLVKCLVEKIVRNGGGIVCAAGVEPLQKPSDAASPSLLFDWTVLSTAGQMLFRELQPQGPRPPIVVVVSEKAEHSIPSSRRALWSELLRANLVRLEQIKIGARSGAMIRDRQTRFGDVLVCLGGGLGVEHLADIYLAQRKSVIPFDIPLGASRGDGSGGAERLYREAREAPAEFLRLRPEMLGSAGAMLAALSTRDTQITDDVVDGLVAIVENLDRPTAFYVRLLNPDIAEFRDVEKFFRSAVDVVVEDLGYRRVEVGTDRATHGFINVAIFSNIHKAELCWVDITGQRPNCFIELGYALGQSKRVIVTAKTGTSLPFDQQAIPCFFWDLNTSTQDIISNLKAFITVNLNRPPIA